QDPSPVDVVLEGGPEGLKIHMAAEDYRLSELLGTRGDWADIDPWLATPFSGEASVSFDDGGITAYEADLSTQIPRERLGLPVQLDARVNGDLERMRVSSARATTPLGRAIFAGSVALPSFMPSGSLYIDGLQPDERFPSLTARFAVEPEGSSLVIRSERIDYGGITATDVETTLTRSRETYRAGLTANVGEQGAIGLRLHVNADNFEDISARFAVNRIRSHRLSSLMSGVIPGELSPGASAFLRNRLFSGSARIESTPDRLHLATASIAMQDIEVPEHRFVASVRERSGEYDGTITVHQDSLSAESSFVASSVTAESVEAMFDVSVNEQNYSFRGTLSDGNRLSLTGDDGSTANVDLLSDGQLRAQVNVRELELPEALLGDGDSGTAPVVSLAASVDYASPREWRVGVTRASAQQLHIAGRPVDVMFSGRLNESGGIIETLELADDYGEVEGAMTLSYVFSPEFSGSANFIAEGVRSDELYEAELEYGPDGMNASARMRAFPLERFEMENFAGTMNADVTLEGTPDEPLVSAGVSLVEASYDEEPIAGSVSVEYAEERVSFSGLTVDYLSSSLTGGSGALDLDEGVFNMTASLEGVRQEEPFVTTLDVDGQMETDGDLFGTDPVRTPFNAQVVLDGIPMEMDLSDRWEFDVRRDTRGEIRVSGGPRESIAATISADGVFSLSLSAPLPVVVEADGVLSAADIEANISRISLDVSSLPEVFDLGEFRIVAGTAEGSLRMTGPIFDPDFFGTLEARGVEGELEIFTDPIGPADGFIVFSEKQMRIQRLSTPVGDAAATFEGTFLISRWEIEQFELDIETESAIGPRIVSDFDSVDIDGFATGSISIAQSGNDVELTGDLVAHNTEVTLSEIDDTEAAEPTGPDDAELVVDLSIEAGRSVEFLWPTEGFPILRAVAQPGDGVNISGDSRTQAFSLNGEVGMQGGELFYFDRTFLIREGLIRFSETQDNFDPRVTVRAETRDIGPEGPIRISLVADESRLSELTVRVVSDPPLPQDEIFALLGAGVFSSVEGGLVNLSGAVLLGSDLASQFGVMRTIESSIRNALQLDLFTVRTQLFQNLVREVIDEPVQTQPQDAPIPSLGRYFDNTTLFLGRSLGPSVFLELLVQLRAEDPFSDAQRQFAAIDVDTELSLEFETPYFDIGWSFLPQSPEKLFVPDNRVTLSWRFTY
ncbi:MAG: translocation/assembly module TamB domain-containing protein, partial [Spirochaetia bacterium]